MWKSRFAALALMSALIGVNQAAVPGNALADRPDDPTKSKFGSSSVAKTAAPPGGAVFSTNESQFDPGTDNQGWWSTGDNPNADDNDNYFVGQAFGGEYRNFFTFDLRKLGKKVASATLRVNTAAISPGTGAEVLRLSDVSTDAATLNDNVGQNASIFEDLGTGTVYGEYPVGSVPENTVLSLQLNEAALRDLRNASGGFFSIGGSLLNVQQEMYLFGGSDTFSAELVVLKR